MPKLLGVYIKTSWILFLSITIGEGKESILLRWLVPEDGQPPERWLPDEQLRQQICVILETFIQLDRFKGTCYQAANWIEVGKTEGYSLFSSYKRFAIAKAIYVYPLRKDFRRQLCSL